VNYRFERLTVDQLSPAQRPIAERAITGPRQKIGSPVNAWLRSPGLADPVARLGEYVRFESSTPERLKELVILVVARHWTAQYPWSVHYQQSMDTGISKATADSIWAGKRPTDMKPDEELIHDFCKTLLDGGEIDDATYARMLAEHGEPGIIDLIGLMGYYTTLSFTLVVDRCPRREGSKAPVLEPLGRAGRGR
jgi:4-carboxymuconolactone decarboxylase